MWQITVARPMARSGASLPDGVRRGHEAGLRVVHRAGAAGRARRAPPRPRDGTGAPARPRRTRESARPESSMPSTRGAPANPARSKWREESMRRPGCAGRPAVAPCRRPDDDVRSPTWTSPPASGISALTRGRCGRRRAGRAGAHRSAAIIARIVSPIRPPGKAQISGWASSCSHGNALTRSSSRGSPERQCWFESERYVVGREVPRLHHVDRRPRSAPTSSRGRGCARRRRRRTDRRARLAGGSRAVRHDGRECEGDRSRRALRPTRGCRRPTRSSGSRSP